MITCDPNEPKPQGLIRVCLALPKFGYTLPHSYMNRLINFNALGHLEKEGEILQNNPRFQFRFAVLGDLFTPLAREEAAKMALDWNCDYLFMIDDDMMCPDDLFLRLYKHDVDIVAPLAFTRNPPHKPVIYSCLEGYDSQSKKDWTMNTVVMNYPRNTLVECDAVGFGAVLIKRHVLEAVPKPRFMSTCGTGEDIYFCYQAKKYGARVFADTSTKIGHLSHPIDVTEEYVDEYRKNNSIDFNKKHPEYSKYKDHTLVVE